MTSPAEKEGVVPASRVKTCPEVRVLNHNHRPCRWFAQAPLGHALGRAYRLIEKSANCTTFPGCP